MRKFQTFVEQSIDEIEGKVVCDCCNNRVDKDKTIMIYNHHYSIALKPPGRRICISCDRDIKLKKILKT